MQGFNMGRYVPPDLEGTTSGNKIHGKKPPGFRGDKQTVRFEMPFNIFCLHCDGHIAQGVRFNAEKKKVSNYYSTPIFSFRMKHSVCSGWIEIRTDPQNTAYVVTEGGKKKAADDEPKVGIIKIHDPSAAITEDPFAKTEKAVTDKTVAKQGAARIAELKELSERQWADPYEHSRKIRKVFRAEGKVLKERATATEAIRDRAGLAIELLDETPEDAQRAKLIDFAPDFDQQIRRAHTRSLFAKPMDAKEPSTLRITPKTRRGDAADLTKEFLQRDLQRNTRAAVDPFLDQGRGSSRPKLLLKRKDRDDSKGSTPNDASSTDDANRGQASSARTLGLDEYASDD